jgi:hypothetical protein
MWEFNWGVFWAVLAALSVYSFARKLNRAAEKKEFWVNLGLVQTLLGGFAFIVIIIAVIYARFFGGPLQHWLFPSLSHPK